MLLKLRNSLWRFGKRSTSSWKIKKEPNWRNCGRYLSLEGQNCLQYWVLLRVPLITASTGNTLCNTSHVSRHSHGLRFFLMVNVHALCVYSVWITKDSNLRHDTHNSRVLLGFFIVTRDMYFYFVMNKDILHACECSAVILVAGTVNALYIPQCRFYFFSSSILPELSSHWHYKHLQSHCQPGSELWVQWDDQDSQSL